MTTNPTIPPEALPHLKATTPRGRGRPPITFDNRRVQAFVCCFVTAHEMCETYPRIDDVLEGCVQAQTPGEAHTRPLSRRKLFLVLQCCGMLTTGSVAEVLPGSALSTAKRYAAAARVASQTIAKLLDGDLRAELPGDSWTMDLPSPEELKALSLLI